MSALLLRYWREIAVVACLLALAGTIYDRGKQAARREAAEALVESVRDSLRVTQRENVALRENVVRRDTVYVTRRDTSRVYVDRYRALRDTVEVVDTVLVAAADSAVSACSTALLACDARISATDSLVAGLEAEIRLLTAQRDAYARMVPSSGDRLKRDLLAGAIGAGSVEVVRAVVNGLRGD